MKKTISKVSAAICSLLMLTCTIPVCADKPVGNYTYECFTYNTNSDDSITIISCDSTAKEINIPAEIKGMPVVAINGSAFQGCNALESITVSNENKYFTVNNAGMLTDKAQTKLIKCPQSIDIYSYDIPDTVKSVSPYCFEGCKTLEYIHIPETVTSIGKSAFSGTSFSNVTIPNSSATIGENAFGFNDNGKIDNFTIYGVIGSPTESYAAKNDLAFVSSSTESFNISVNGNLYFYNTDTSFSGEKIKISSKSGSDAVFTFSSTPSKVFAEHGTALTKVDTLTFLGNTISSVNVKVAMAGDANADGKFNVRDAAYLASSLAKGSTFSGFDKMCADKNKNGKVDIRDAAEIARELAGVKNS